MAAGQADRAAALKERVYVWESACDEMKKRVALAEHIEGRQP